MPVTGEARVITAASWERLLGLNRGWMVIEATRRF
jgi:hypothetical protein